MLLRWSKSLFFRLVGYTTVLILLCCAFSSLEARPPKLSAKDIRIKIEEILKAHVCHQKLTEEIVSRAIQNYLEELDPGKTYFLESDIAPWITPSKELLRKTNGKQLFVQNCTHL